MMFSLFTGRKFANQIADHMYMRPNFLGTILLEVGVTWAHLKILKKGNMSVEQAADTLLPAMYEGIQSLRNKFGDDPEIMSALDTVNRRLKQSKPDNEGEVINALDRATLTPKMVALQLQMIPLGVGAMTNNISALGYLFGMAEMEYFQKGGDLKDQTKSLNYILTSFNQIAPEESSDSFETCLNMQKSPKFAAGRQKGADEMNDWFKTSGQKKPLGLIEMLRP